MASSRYAEYSPVAAQTTAALVLALVFLMVLACKSYVFSEDPATQEAEKVAEKVKQKAERTEKAEGRRDLVKDEVKVKIGDDGKPVVEQTGEASYYGPGFHGKKTATGEKFDQNELTAAHPALPLGTKATVTNLDNGNSVEVEINDRGPYVAGRDIDVSKRAAKELGMSKEGVAPVKIEAKVKPGAKKQEKK
jgi:rare lipoprotein A (peptidoglycan hydrolase)